MNTYNVGNVIRTTATFTDNSGALVDPLQVSITLTDPNGAAVVAPLIVRDSLGMYHADITVPALATFGLWVYVWVVSGDSTGSQGSFLVAAPTSPAAPNIVIPASFRVNYPEFADHVAFPDTSINYWVMVAGKLLNPCVWQTMLLEATSLFVAHNIVLEKQSVDTASFGGAPGVATGPVSSKSVDKVSVSYDTSSSMEEGAGHWNLTIYGTRFAQLMRYFGAGPVQV